MRAGVQSVRQSAGAILASPPRSQVACTPTHAPVRSVPCRAAPRPREATLPPRAAQCWRALLLSGALSFPLRTPPSLLPRSGVCPGPVTVRVISHPGIRPGLRHLLGRCSESARVTAHFPPGKVPPPLQLRVCSPRSHGPASHARHRCLPATPCRHHRPGTGRNRVVWHARGSDDAQPVWSGCSWFSRGACPPGASPCLQGRWPAGGGYGRSPRRETPHPRSPPPHREGIVRPSCCLKPGTLGLSSCSHRQHELQLSGIGDSPCAAFQLSRAETGSGEMRWRFRGFFPARSVGLRARPRPRTSRKGRVLKSRARLSNLRASDVFMCVSESSSANCLLFSL